MSQELTSQAPYPPWGSDIYRFMYVGYTCAHKKSRGSEFSSGGLYKKLCKKKYKPK